MSRTERLSRGAGFLMLGGVLLSGVSAFGADEPPLSNQLTELGRQALAQGSSKAAKGFFEKALTLDPSNRGGGARSERRRSCRTRRRQGCFPGCQARSSAGRRGAGDASPACSRDRSSHDRAKRGCRKHRPSTVDQRCRATHPECRAHCYTRAFPKRPLMHCD